MNKYYALLLSILLLMPCVDIKSMNHVSDVKNKMLLASIVVGFVVTGYSFFKFLTWLKPLKPVTQRTGNNQIIGNVSAKGDISIKQTGGGDNNTQIIGNVVGGSVSINQTGDGNNNTQMTDNVVGGAISIHQTGDNNRISDNSTTTSGSFAAFQDKHTDDASDATTTRKMLLVGDRFLEKIIASGTGQLLISQDKSLKKAYASITAEKSIIDNLSIVKEGNNLIIGQKKNTIMCSTKPILYEITIREIPQLSIKGNLAVQFITKITQDHLLLKLHDNASIDCRANCAIDVKKITTSAIGSSKIYLHGVAPEQTITLRGNTHYNAQEILSHRVTIKGFDNSQADLLLEDSPGNLYGPVKSEINGVLHGNSKLFYQGSDSINNLICNDNSNSYKRIE